MLGEIALDVIIFAAGWFARAKFGTFSEMKKYVTETAKRWTN